MEFERIRNLREDSDLTQEEMAAILKVKRSTYAMWELGDIGFPLTKLVELKEHFKISIDYLLGLSKDKKYIPTMSDFTLEKFGEQLKLYRLKNNMTQKEFGKRLGINQSAYAYYEYGYTQMTSKKLYQLSLEFHISIDRLLSGKPFTK